MRAGPRGPLLLQDYHLFERTARFNRARPPARAVHAKGAGAFGTFRVTGDITAHTKASLFAGVGTETPVLARFSNANGERGAADAERDLRGFALRFYTTAGNWDLIGSNSPVFFVRDPMAFPDAVRARARDPRSNLRDPAMQWDFWSSFPESLHQVTMLMSDRGLPRSYRHMNGYGGHTYAFINAEGERVWVKIHLTTQQGVQTMDADEAARVIGWDRDSHQRDLATAIAAGEHPKWTMYVQVMPVQDAQTVPYDPFDVTKVWPHGDYPLIEVGEIELNQRPDDHAAEVEQAAFQPANLVPGIGVSPDKMLQARLIAYADAQHDRLGVNHDRLPVNQPRRPAGTDDGGHASEHAAAFDEPPLTVGGTADRHGDGPANDDTTQAGNLFRLMTPEQQTRLINTIVTDMHGVPTAIQRRQIGHFYRADPAYGAGVARGLGIDLADAAE
jgi:catalase